MDPLEKQKKLAKIAEEVLQIARNTLTVTLRFMDTALSMLRLEEAETVSLVTNGRVLGYNGRFVVNSYVTDPNTPVRDYLHVVFHCVFLHPFGGIDIDPKVWDLATDMAVENAINDLKIPSLINARARNQMNTLNYYRQRVKFLTAETLYRYFMDHPLSDEEYDKLRGYFMVDEHYPWYVPAKKEGGEGVEDGESEENEGGSASGKSRKKSGDGENDSSDGNGDSEGEQGSNPDQQSGSGDHSHKNTLSRPGEQDEEEWKKAAHKTQVDMETFSKNIGTEAGSMIQNLKEVTKEKYDYTEFLKKFAVMGEAMKINDDEFDYVYYTYGLKLYDDMPLIEPLEYKEVKRIREFVIAIDTSGSVAGELVQGFIQKTYNILKSTESFFEKINLWIIQCDTVIQDAVKITSQEEFDRFMKTVQLKGFGGTDFRPVFTYVDKLIAEKEFERLKGLIYFTDGYGTFPAKMPAYQTAFVFLDDGYEIPQVPPWAIKLVLDEKELKKGIKR